MKKIIIAIAVFLVFGAIGYYVTNMMLAKNDTVSMYSNEDLEAKASGGKCANAKAHTRATKRKLERFHGGQCLSGEAEYKECKAAESAWKSAVKAEKKAC